MSLHDAWDCIQHVHHHASATLVQSEMLHASMQCFAISQLQSHGWQRASTIGSTSRNSKTYTSATFAMIQHWVPVIRSQARNKLAASVSELKSNSSHFAVPYPFLVLYLRVYVPGVLLLHPPAYSCLASLACQHCSSEWNPRAV